MKTFSLYDSLALRIGTGIHEVCEYTIDSVLHEKLNQYISSTRRHDEEKKRRQTARKLINKNEKYIYLKHVRINRVHMCVLCMYEKWVARMSWDVSFNYVN